jgi:hypothetical protein
VVLGFERAVSDVNIYAWAWTRDGIQTSLVAAGDTVGVLASGVVVSATAEHDVR